MKFEEVRNRINELYNKSLKESLTDEEKIEQQELRKIYLENFRNNFKAQLEAIKKPSVNNNKN